MRLKTLYYYKGKPLNASRANPALHEPYNPTSSLIPNFQDKLLLESVGNYYYLFTFYKRNETRSHGNQLKH